MELTSEILDRYKGGQVEVQNAGEGYMYRGEIEDIYVSDDNSLTIRLVWMAKGEGFPPLPERWVNDTNLNYAASLEIYSVSDIGYGRVLLQSTIVGETVVLYLPDGSKLDPSKVEGLELATS